MADLEQRVAALEKQSQGHGKMTSALKEAHNNEHDVVKTLLEQGKAQEKTIFALKEAHNNQHDVVKTLLERVAVLEKKVENQSKVIETHGGGV